MKDMFNKAKFHSKTAPILIRTAYCLLSQKVTRPDIGVRRVARKDLVPTGFNEFGNAPLGISGENDKSSILLTLLHIFVN